MTISGCGPSFRCLRTIPTFGLWNKPDSIVATSAQYSFYLSIFFHCRKGLIVQRPLSSTRQFGNFLPLAQTTMGFHTTKSSSHFLPPPPQQTVLRSNSIVGGDPTFGLQFPQTFQDGRNASDHTNLVFTDATLFASSHPTLANHNGRMLSMRLTGPSNFGKASVYLDAHLYELHGYCHLHGPLTYVSYSTSTLLRCGRTL